MTHCTSVIVACRSAWSTRKATFTTVASRNVMLEPMMVAARIQRRRGGMLVSCPQTTRSEVWTAVALRTRLPVISHWLRAPPRRNGHHQGAAEADDVRLVRSARLRQSRIGLRRSIGMKTRPFQLPAQPLQVFLRQAIGFRVWTSAKDLREIDGGVSRDRKGDVRLPGRQLVDSDDDERGYVEYCSERRHPRLP